MRVVVGVDPGLRACGVAIADAATGVVLRAWLVKSPEKKDGGALAIAAMANAVVEALLDWVGAQSAQVVVEALYVEDQAIRIRPVRMGPKVVLVLITRAPKAILRLADIAGGILLGCVRALSPVRYHLPQPSEWHGKDGPAARRRKMEVGDLVWERLTAEERAAVEGADLKTTGHNVKDAVGMAKKAAERAAAGML